MSRRFLGAGCSRQSNWTEGRSSSRGLAGRPALHETPSPTPTQYDRGMRVAVLIPGIMGSSLYQSSVGGRQYLWSESLWDNYQTLVSNPSVLAWTGQKAEAELIDTIQFTRFGLRGWHLWTRVLSFLSGHPEFGKAGYVLRLGYDWRQSLADTGQELLGDIDRRLRIRFPGTAPDAIRLTLVTHSMGGLLVRAAIGVGALPPDRIDRIVHIGSPLEGAPDAFYAAYAGKRLPMLRDISDMIHGRNSYLFWDLLKATVQTFPSVYEVMPFPDNKFLAYTPSRQFNPFDADPPSYIDPIYLIRARAFHQVMQDAETIIAEDKIIVYTLSTQSHSQCLTDVGYRVKAVAAPFVGYEVLEVMGRTTSGDGTVLADSARGNPLTCKNVPVVNVKHSAMCNDKKVVRVLASVV